MNISYYINLIENNRLNDLQDVFLPNDLIRYKYKGLYLIEYLLRENIHNNRLDNIAQFDSNMAMFYLKYNITKPLLKMDIYALMDIVNGKRFLDLLLDKLPDDDKEKVLEYNKRVNYWQVHDYEGEIVDIYKKHGITIKPIFIKSLSVFDYKVSNRKSDNDLLKEFASAFKDSSNYILNVYLHELKRRLSKNPKQARVDIKRLIRHKKEYKDFSLKLTNYSDGEYDGDLSINPKVVGVITHELSHLFYEWFDEDGEDYKKYEKIKDAIHNEKTINNIINYIKLFHQRYEEMGKYFENIYYREVNKKYGNLKNYAQKVSFDIFINCAKMIYVSGETIDDMYLYINEYSLEATANELLIIEKCEFVNDCLRNYYSAELTLENLLDALLNGAITDGLGGIEYLSGHEGIYFARDESASFEECLADYEEIKFSKYANRIINTLETLVGRELIDFLDNYIERVRNKKSKIPIKKV